MTTKAKSQASLPSGDQISYSELNTFDDWCRLQHYYRYFMRMQTKRYGKLRYLTIGSMVHDTIEEIYTRGLPRESMSDQGIKDLIDEISYPMFQKYMQPSYRPHFSQDAFEHDKHVAFHLVRIFVEAVYVVEKFELVGVEESFETSLPGVEELGLVGRKDQDYRVCPPENGLQVGPEIRDHKKKNGTIPPGRYLGEMKTRGSSFSSRIDTTVEKDFQTDVYMAAGKQEGIDYRGVIYTVLQKPPNDLIFTTDYKEAREEMDLYYASSSPFDHVRRDVVPVEMTEKKVKEIEEKVSKIVGQLREFYQNPYERVAEFEKPHPKAFPCRMCEYLDVCQKGEDVNGSFTYKKKRS